MLTINGFSVATALDEDLLTSIATVTNGKYFNAQDTATLSQIYDNIDLKTVTDAKRTEITAVVTALATVLLLIGAGLSLLWFGRLV